MNSDLRKLSANDPAARMAAKLRPLVAGAMLAVSDTSAGIISPSLGACVCVAVYDPVVKIGGMLHALLPDSSLNRTRAAQRPQLFVDTGVPALLHTVASLGGATERLVAAVAGGAEFIGASKSFNIGRRNTETVLAMLARSGVKLGTCSIGGQSNRTLRLDLHTGAVTLETPGRWAINL